MIQYIFLVAGLAGGFLVYYIFLRTDKTYKIWKMLKRKEPMVFLETDKATYIRQIKKIYKNLGITTNREIIILPKSSIKPCLNLGGKLIAHGDLYKSVTTPQEMRILIHRLKKEGWREEDIAKFFEEIETIPPERLTATYKRIEDAKGMLKQDEDELQKKYEAGDLIAGTALQFKGNPNSKEFLKYQLYRNLPSVVKDFIYTGLNRVSIHSMLRELVYQRELEKGFGKDWLKIAIAVMIIAIAIGLAFRFIMSTPGLAETVGAIVSPPPRISP